MMNRALKAALLIEASSIGLFGSISSLTSAHDAHSSGVTGVGVLIAGIKGVPKGMVFGAYLPPKVLFIGALKLRDTFAKGRD